jgi:hypothetical protein
VIDDLNASSTGVNLSLHNPFFYLFSKQLNAYMQMNELMTLLIHVFKQRLLKVADYAMGDPDPNCKFLLTLDSSEKNCSLI